MVGKSIAIHKRSSAGALSIVKEENVNRIDLYFYYYRNNLIGFWEYESWTYRILCMGKLWYDFFQVLIKGNHKIRKMKVIISVFLHLSLEAMTGRRLKGEVFCSMSERKFQRKR